MTVRNTKNPKITFELMGEGSVKINTEWPKNANIKPFVHLIAYLCEGKLTDGIISVLTANAKEMNEGDKVPYIHSILQNKGEISPQNSNKPIVCPTQAVRMNMKPFQE